MPVPSTPITIDYVYDDLYRLTEANYSTGDYYQYEYDAVGNRETQTTLIGGLPSSFDYDYDDANRLIEVNGVEYDWDDAGNLLDDGMNVYEYDSANRLISLSGPGVNATYSYNGLGDRLQETTNGQTTTFTMDLNSGLTQVLDDGTNTYLYGLGRIAQIQGTTTDYFLSDALGSVRQLTDQTGAVTYARAYDPYGVVTAATGASGTPYGYTGEYTSNDLVYLRARHYDPGMGRFLTRDTWTGNYNRPLSLNQWNYVEANPINATDPSGYIKETETADADKIVRELKAYNVNILVDWGYLPIPYYSQMPASVQALYPSGCYWNDGLWLIEELEAVRDGIILIDRGVRYLGGNFPTLARSFTIKREVGIRSTAAGGTIFYRVDGRVQGNRLGGLVSGLVHEVGHIISQNNPELLSYFRVKLGARCFDSVTDETLGYCFRNDGGTDDYDPGDFAGNEISSTTNGGRTFEYLPSIYAAEGAGEDYAETFRVVVSEAYINSGDTAYNLTANIVYTYQNSNSNIGKRRQVMVDTLNGNWLGKLGR